jgi:hypothetical protein
VVDETLGSGDPGAIAELGRAYIAAEACTAKTYEEFARAQARFQSTWNRESGKHPINDSAAVQNTTTGLLSQKEQLPAIGAELSNIAADLAAAQRFCHSTVETLNTELRYVDALINQALMDDDDTADLEMSAVAMTSNAFREVDGVRADYAAKLAASLTTLRYENGYDPAAIDGADGDGITGLEERGRESTEWYDAVQRTKDQALVESPTSLSAEKAEAAARLRDYALTTNPAVDDATRRLAAERLDDYRMANFVDPLPADPLLGGTARDRARNRLDLQRRLEQGYGEIPPMTPDQATRLLTDGEQFGRVVATKQAIDGLRRAGLSEDGARKAVNELLTDGSDLNGQQSDVLDEAYGDGPREDWRIRVAHHLSPADAEGWEKIAGKLGTVANIVELASAINDKANGGSWEDLCGTAGGLAGGIGAGWATGLAVAGTLSGPWTAVAVGIASVLGGLTGEEVGGAVCAEFDPVPAAPPGGR